MKKNVILFFILLMFGCQKASSKTEQISLVNSEKAPLEKEVSENSEINCEEFYRQIVLSSNLSAVKNYKDIFVRIESSSEDKVVLELYTKNNLSESSANKQIVENAVSWLNFLPGSEKLFDITADPEEPVELNFNKELLTKFDFRAACGLKTKIIENQKNKLSKTNCKEITGDMLSGEECIVTSNSLESVYREMIDNSLVKDSEFLLKNLPKINTSEKVNKNGIVNISYKINPNVVTIEMLYEGGITDIVLTKQNKTVKRKIVYNAD